MQSMFFNNTLISVKLGLVAFEYVISSLVSYGNVEIDSAKAIAPHGT